MCEQESCRRCALPTSGSLIPSICVTAKSVVQRFRLSKHPTSLFFDDFMILILNYDSYFVPAKKKKITPHNTSFVLC